LLLLKRSVPKFFFSVSAYAIGRHRTFFQNLTPDNGPSCPGNEGRRHLGFHQGEKTMIRTHIVGVSALAAVAVAMLSASAPAQQKSLKDQLIGAWTHVSTKYKFPDGKTADTMGPNARGILILDASGEMAFINMKATLPKFASNDRTKGTPEENKAIVEGSYSYFGKYTINETDHSFTVHIDGSTFPNFDGADQKRVVTITGDELKYTNPVATIGAGVVVEATWRRAK
jgi:hypothetical protein